MLDRLISYLSPRIALQRMQYRIALQHAGDLKRQYEGAAAGRRTSNWSAKATGPNSEIHLALTKLRNRSRDLARNNPYARNAVKKIATNVVGTGILPSPKLENAEIEKKLKQVWNDWADSTQCDYDGHLNFYGLQRLVMRTVAESGECLVRKRIVFDKTLEFPLQLQVLEGDFIDTFKYGSTSDGGQILYGVEFDKRGKIIAYWLYDQHPGELNLNSTFNSTRYPADEIIHVFEKERPGQFRGVPAGSPSMLRLKDLDDYEDAQLVRQKIAACFSVFVTEPHGVSGMGNGSDDDLTDRVEPGIIQSLPPGKQVEFASPPPADGYGEYTKNVLRGIAAGYGMDYVTLTGDLTAVNFSSGRMGWIEFNRTVSEWQWQMMLPMFCDKAYTWFTQIAAVFGHVKAGVKIRVSWSPPRREQINPEAETKAAIAAMQNGVSAWSDVQLENGYNPEEQIAKMKKDMDMFKNAGLPIYTDIGTKKEAGKG